MEFQWCKLTVVFIFIAPSVGLFKANNHYEHLHPTSTLENVPRTTIVCSTSLRYSTPSGVA
jgi:hypothetical protein